jgi:exodeoxyribonuclease VII large subunit
VVRNKVELIQSLESLGRRLHNAGRTTLENRRERLFSLIPRLADPRRRFSDFRFRLDDLSVRLANSTRQSLSRKQEQLKSKGDGLLHLYPGRRVAEHAHRVTHLSRQMAMALRTQLRLLRQRTEGCKGKLQTLSPLAVLERGYSIARLLPSKEVIRRASDVKVASRVNVKVHRGEFVARVEEIKENEPDHP